MEKTRKNLGLGLIPIAALFFCNPNISVIDVLPDFIGYLLLFIALRQIADLNYHSEDALGYTKKMLYVSGAQLLSLVLVFGLLPPKEQPTMFLLTSFIVSFFEILFLPKLYGEMIEGFTYLSTRSGTDGTPGGGRNNKFRKITVIFVITKAVMSVLPEFSALTAGSYDDDSFFSFLYDYISLLRTFSVLLMLPFGIYWLVSVIKYFKFLLSDKQFMTSLEEKYEAEIIPKEHIFVQRAVRIAFAFLIAGAIFTLDLNIDNHSILPDFLFPLFWILSLVFMKKYVGNRTKAFIACGVNLITSVAVYALNAYFYRNYTLLLTRMDPEAYDAFFLLWILICLDSVAFLFSFLTTASLLRGVVKEHTGYAPLSDANFNQEDKIKYVHDMLARRITILTVIASVCAVSTPVCTFLTRLLFIQKNYSFYWIIEFVLYLIFVIELIKTLSSIRQEIGYKYLLA